MTVHVLQHVPFEGPGAIAHWARLRGHTLFCHRLYLGAPLPAADTGDLVVAMGGPMSVNDEHVYHWLAAEKQLLAGHLARGGRVFGVCLGAQLIAAALGARVYPQGFTEIGWFPITPTDPDSRLFASVRSPMPVLHWHGETFDLPAGARLLARSAACTNQAFSVDDRALGLQFHLEMEYSGVAAIVAACAEETARKGTWVQPASSILAENRSYAGCRGALYRILDELIA